MPRGRPKKSESTATPPTQAKFTRNEDGLIEGEDYIFNEDGSVNWRDMIKDDHLFPNRSWFESRGKDMPSSTNGLQDFQLLIKLGGIKELAKLRGFKSVKYNTVKCEKDHVAVICEIEFIGNYETGGQTVTFQDMANANLQNTSSFATKFLETIACNRAFVRAVRNFLNVHIVGDDEIDKSSPTSEPSSFTASLTPNGILENKFENFSSFQDKLRQLWKKELYRNDFVTDWSAFDDIPPKEARVLIKLLK